MNKLYKYLPFDVKMKSNQTGTIWTLKGYSSKHNSFVGEDDFYYGESKPILSPLTDLTKEIPLTKVAANMIDLEEGEPVYIPTVIKDLTIYGFYTKRCLYSETTLKDNKLVIENYAGSNITLDWNNEVYNKTLKLHYIDTYKHIDLPINSELVFDFLRAMHFNLDFQEGEFIKLE
jgi:hypothetical protein